MLKVEKKEVGGVLNLRLEGVIDEQTAFATLLGAPTGEVRVHCKGVRRINSAGVKQWRTYFANLRQGGVKVRFQEASPALVSQTSLLADFMTRDEVESVCLSYLCESCDRDLLHVATVGELAALKFQPPVVKCEGCIQPMQFDDLPQEYFGLWRG